MRPGVISELSEYITTEGHTGCQQQTNTNVWCRETLTLLGEDPLIEQKPKHPVINP